MNNIIKRMKKFMSMKAIRNLIYYVIVFIAGIFVSLNWMSEDMLDQVIPGIVAIVFTILGINETVEDDDSEDSDE